MKLALISDIHGNLEALTAVLEDIENQKVDKIYCLGDVIGYGSDPCACLKLVEQNCDIKLMGNHEYVALGLISTENYNEAAKISSDWTKNQLTENDFSIISNFEMKHSWQDFLWVHASPFEPEQWHYIIAPDMAFQAFSYFDEKICFFGHSHLPQIYMEQEDNFPRMQGGHDFLPAQENRYLINVGSVGQPRDNDPRACYLIFDTEEDEVIYRRIAYDINLTQKKMSEQHIPEMLIDRLEVGR
ncbi:MAG: metallophosphoesterase family protein [FCB group bacterium]|nr:metallophosphoesterase family protein [FCB group bacterium]